MMKKFKRALATLMCAVLMFTSNGISSFAAENTEVTDTGIATVSDAEEDTEEQIILPEEPVEETQLTNSSGQLINYVSIGAGSVTTPADQFVLVGIGDGTKTIENAILHYTNVTTNTEYQAACAEVNKDGLLFNMSFPDESLAGSYILDYIEFNIEGVTSYIKFADAGIEAGFGVNTESETEPDGVVVDGDEEEANEEEVDGFTITDANGESLSKEELADAVNSAMAGSGSSIDSKSIAADGSLVIVLDPGHGGTDSGATRTWGGVTYAERELNLKIAEYCKAALEKYVGVDVYMTRNDNSSTCMTRQERAIFARDKHADILVSIHINSTGSNETASTGVEVWYPNENYNPAASETGHGVGQAILDRLKALGIATRGCYIRNSDDGSTYPDGSLTDYYGINYWCKYYGFPGIIVEHGFINNPSECAKLFGSEAALKTLGEADAYGLAKYFNLTTEEEYTANSATVEAVKMGAGDVYTLKASNVPNLYGLFFLAYNADGSIIKRYNSIKGDDGCWYGSLDAAALGIYGTAGIDAYAMRSNGSYYKVGGTYLTLEVQGNYNVIESFNADNEKAYFLTASNVINAANVKSVLFTVKNENSTQQVDYAAAQQADGRYLAIMGISDFKLSGKYTVTAKSVWADGSKHELGTTSFEVSVPTAESITIANVNNNNGTFDVIVSGVLSTAGVAEVKVPAWTASDLSDIAWYTAARQEDGSFVAHIDFNNHKSNYGLYAVQAYVTAENGVTALTASNLYNLEQPATEISAFDADNQKTYILVADGVPYGNRVAQINYAVWNEGLNDLRGYQAAKQSDGRYMAFLSINDYKKAGTYHIEAFAVLTDGSNHSIGSTSFTIKEPSAKSLVFSNIDRAKGTFDITISSITSASGVTGVRVPVWSASDFSDLHWYDAAKQADGSYKVTANIENHKYNYGVYAVQAYVTAGNGICAVAASNCVNIEQPKATLEAYDVGDENTYILTADDVPFGNRVTSVRFSVWNEGLSDLRAYPSMKTDSGRYMAFMALTDYNKTGTYYVAATAVCSDGSTYDLGITTFEVSTLLYGIMGTSVTTVDQMVKYYNSRATYPAFYASSDAPTIEAFCQLYYEECQAEGVKAEVAFCQAMKETGFLKFGGVVKIEQFNFAGLGATDSGGTPASFGSVREGIRAQVQHLKGYASTEALANPCVDPRFSYLENRRGIAPYVEWLGQKENPQGFGWATAVGYGFSIRNDYMQKLFSY